MSTLSNAALCGHCGLPVGPRATRHTLDAEQHAFCCYGCSLAWQVGHGNGAESEATWLLIRLGVGAFLAMNIKMLSMLLYFGAFDETDAHLLPLIHAILWVLATPMLAVLGWPFARDAWHEARRHQLTANTLMSIGVLAAYGYSAIAVMQGSGDVYFDTVALLLVLFTLGRLLEAAARARAVRSLAPMLEAERQWVTRVANEVAGGTRNRDGGDVTDRFDSADRNDRTNATEAGHGATERLRVRDVLPGMHVRVLPGERVPVDGVVVTGDSHVDESILTGEARPVAKHAGCAVLSGSINHEGCLTIEATVAGSHGRWALICRAVQDALAQRSPAARLTDRVAGAFVPLVMVLAAFAVLYWSAHVPLPQALFTGLAVLVVACPCALGLAAPLATTLGIGGLVRRGILVRGPEVLERLTRAKVIAFDKTGTLTAGELRLAAIETDGKSTADDLLRHAAGVEQGSEHPLARAVLHAATARALIPVTVSAVRALPGRGVIGSCDGKPIAVGTTAVMDELGWHIPAALRTRITRLEASGQTVVHVGWDARWRGALMLADTLMADAADTVRRLQALGLHCVLLTGDLPAAAQRVAAAVGIDDWHAQHSPEDKLAEVERLSRTYGPVVMVGDGLNDGPVLAAAAVGVAVGSATDLARETADMTLPPGGLHLLHASLKRARRVRGTILTNLLWAFGYNGIALALAALGYLSPIWAALIMAGSSLLVIANSMRLERGSGPDSRAPATLPPVLHDVAAHTWRTRPLIDSGPRAPRSHASPPGS